MKINITSHRVQEVYLNLAYEAIFLPFQRVTFNIKYVEFACIGIARGKRLLIIFVLFSAIVSFCSGGSDCPPNWFGDSCRQKCHCLYGSGDCTDGVCADACEPFYFGDKCQFMAIQLKPIENANAPWWLVDGNPETCSNGDQRQYASFNLLYPSGVLHVNYIFKEGSSPGMPEIYLRDATEDAIVPCHLLTDEIQSYGNGAIFQCPSTQVAHSLSIAGPSLQDLCEIYVSPGTNKALGSLATISDLSIAWKGPNETYAPIVEDGDRESCMEIPDGRNFLWRYRSNPVDVGLIWIYGSGKGTWRPAAIEATVRQLAPGSGSVKKAHYVEKYLKFIDIWLNVRNVEEIEIRASGGWPYICEVEIYGASSLCQEDICMDELSPCSAQCKSGPDSCSSRTSECEHGCNPGFEAPFCRTTCPRYSHGEDCQEICPSSCGPSLPDCHPLSGDCYVCPPRHHGSKCDMICNSNCHNGTCQKETGLCLSGCEGNFIPPECTGCKEGWYGEHCSNLCSPYCEGGTCHIETGECFNCLKGWTGKNCSINVNEVQDDCAENGLCNISSGMTEAQAALYRHKKERSMIIVKTLLVSIFVLMVLGLAKMCIHEHEIMKQWRMDARLALHHGEDSGPASKSSSASVHSSSDSSSDDGKEAIHV